MKTLLLSALPPFILFSSLLASPSTCSPDPFVEATRLLTGRPVLSLAIGDLDADAHPDIAVLTSDNNSGTLTVYLLRGVGDGTFLESPTPAATLAYGYFGSLVLLDVNHDGKLDLVVATQTGVDVALGNGDGTFQPAVLTVYGVNIYLNSPATIVGGFFDSDGNPDVAVSSGYTDSNARILVLKGNGDGTFSSPQDLAPAAGGHRLRLADLNGDSHLDLIATNSQAGTISVFRGDAAGSFSAPRLDFAAGSLPYDLSIADIDGDGKLDAAVSVSGFVAVLRGNGDGTFAAAYQYPSGASPGPIVATDVNGDGRADVAVAGQSTCCAISGSFWISLASPTGALGSPATYIGAYFPTAMGSGDFDGDGATDFVVGGQEGIAILKGVGALQFLAAPVVFLQGYVLADIDEDGRPELLSAAGNSVTSSAWSAEGGFRTSTILNFSTPISLLAVGDFNGDGHHDLVISRFTTSGFFSFLPGRGDGTFGDPIDLPATFNTALGGTGDFNGDGKLDLVFSNPYDSSIQVMLGNGDFTFQPPTLLQTTFGAGIVRAVDVTGDGITDLVVISYPTLGPSTVDIFVGSPSGFGAPIVQSVAGYSLDVHDLDGDQKPDLLVSGGPNLALYKGNGNGTFQDPIYVGVAGSPQRAVAGDFDHDGIVDIASAEGGRISLLRGLGSFGYQTPTDQYVGNTVTFLAAADVTGGGVPDLLVNVDFGSGFSPVVLLQSAALAATAPANRTVCLGSPVTLKTSASGYGPVTYQWRKGGVPLSDGPGISGTATPTLSIAAAAAGDQGFYDVFVTDLCTTALSGVGVLTVATPVSAPTIGPASVPAGTATVTISIASPAPPGGAAVLVNGSVPATIAAGATSTIVDLPTGAPGSSLAVTAVVTVGGCSSPLASRTISVDFLDVPSGNPLREFVNTVARNGVTAGCGNGDYCPGNDVTRSQMAVFLLRSNDGPGYFPPPCTVATFGDVPCSNPFARWVDELASRGVTAGCGGGNFCPFDSVTRAQMAVFLLKTHDGPSYTPPPCTTAPFADVSCASPFAPWIQELVVRGITAGCGGGNYCPDGSVSRGQMAVLLVETFSLQ